MRKLAFLLLFGTVAVAQEEVEGDRGQEEAEESGLGALAGTKWKAKPIDFSKVDRTIRKLPELKAEKPLYALFLFGIDGETRVWAVLDKSAKDKDAYDVLHLDRNADGDLTGKGERIDGGNGTFSIGDFEEPGTEVVHKGFLIQHAKGTFFYSLKWAGGTVLSGPHGPTMEESAPFGPSPKEAPIFLLGTERPFDFEHWMSGTLKRGQTTDFKVFIGNKGDRRGAFTCVDDKFLAKGERVLVQLVCSDAAGKERRLTAELAERC